MCNSGMRRNCKSICGEGSQLCINGEWDECDAPLPGDTVVLPATVRDFLDTHPDFEGVIGEDPGIVEAALGVGQKPVYAGMPTTPTTNGKQLFDQWYRDVPGVNLSAPFDLILSKQSDDLRYVISDQTFFPVDEQLLGNQGRPNNFHFTLELHTQFRYRGGEVFRFEGDDDFWVFINDVRVIDLGGVHSSQLAAVDLDEVAEALSLTEGEIYPLDLFFAERHTSKSTFRIETTISEFDACP